MAEELAIKRLRYFNHQFLRVEDFQEEQDYHLRMRRRLNRVLHTWGVAEGLAVTAAAGANSVKVAPGTAIDEQGREIVLLTERTEPLATYTTKTVFVTLRYLEEPTDETDETGTGQEARRWTERAEVRIVDAAPARQGDVLLLARVNLAADGTVASVDEGDVAARRRYAGVVGGDLEVRSLALASEGRPAAEYPLFRWGAAGRADLTGSLRVTQNAAVEGTLAVTGASTLGGKVAVGIGTAAPRTALHVPEAGIQIGASSTVANNFHFVSDEVPASAPRALRVYGGNYGSGTHLLSVTAAGRVGIGVANPTARLQVSGGAIMPATGNSAEAGIMFPENPGSGSGDAAWIRYYPRTAEHTTLEIGTANDPEDHIALMASGGVGIGTVAPEDKLHVHGSARLLTDSNPLRITGAYTGFPNAANKNAEISNDTGTYKTLMIVGNKSGGGPRKVSVWEWLDVFGPLNTTGDILTGAAQGSKFIFHNRGNFSGDSLQVTWDDALGNWQWGKGFVLRRSDGAFGIGTGDPKDKLHVHGNMRILTDGNPIRFTSTWSGFPDAVTNQSEISNDTSGHKTLMIIGNKSLDGATRRVSVWDRLEVNGVLAVNGLFESAPNVTTIIAHDLLFGHPGRRGSAGRALVDGTNVLHLNYGTDWRDGVLYGGAINRASSRALKDDIVALGTDEALGILHGLDPVRYHLKADETRRPQLGFIAEDVPEPIAAAGRIGVTNDHIVAVLTRVVKDQQARIEALSRKIEERSVARA